MERRRIEFVIAENPPKRLDKAVSRDVPEEATLSRTRLARLIDEGALSVDGVVTRDPKARVEAGAVIAVTVEEASDSHIGPEDIPLDVIYEDDDLIVVNKKKMSVTFTGLAEKPIPSLLRGFSAPVLIEFKETADDAFAPSRTVQHIAGGNIARLRPGNHRSQ